jgi:hypothetical protein
MDVAYTGLLAFTFLLDAYTGSALLSAAMLSEFAVFAGFGIADVTAQGTKRSSIIKYGFASHGVVAKLFINRWNLLSGV